MKKEKIIYMPYPYLGRDVNEITRNMVNILSEKYNVVDRMDPSLKYASIMETKAIFLNWNEQNITEEQKKQILKYKKYGTKIIWFFHNRVAHEEENISKEKNNMIWLADNSDYIIILSESSKQYVPGKEKNKNKVRYVPHIKYNSRENPRITQVLKERYNIKEDEFVYCIFGAIRPYKNIETAIRCFNMIRDEKVRLIIAGKPITEEYGNEISKLTVCNKKIITDFRFLSDVELDGIISLSDIVLMTYVGASSMNSGVLIKAFSEGRTVIAPEICMVNDIFEKGDFFYKWQSGNDRMLCELMLQVHKEGKEGLHEKGERAKRYIEDNHSEEIVKNAIEAILNEDNEKKQLMKKRSERKKISPSLEDEVEFYSESYRRYHYLFRIMCQWMELKNKQLEISAWVKKAGWKRVAIYGMGEMGQILLADLRDKGINVVYGIDKNADNIRADIPLVKISESLEEVDGIIVTAVAFYDEVKKEVQNKIDVPVISIKDILDELLYIDSL